MYLRCQSGGVKESDNPNIQEITHRIILGRTGVNKTVLLKSIIEEMILSDNAIIEGCELATYDVEELRLFGKNSCILQQIRSNYVVPAPEGAPSKAPIGAPHYCLGPKRGPHPVGAYLKPYNTYGHQRCLYKTDDLSDTRLL